LAGVAVPQTWLGPIEWKPVEEEQDAHPVPQVERLPPISSAEQFAVQLQEMKAELARQRQEMTAYLADLAAYMETVEQRRQERRQRNAEFAAWIADRTEADPPSAPSPGQGCLVLPFTRPAHTAEPSSAHSSSQRRRAPPFVEYRTRQIISDRGGSRVPLDGARSGPPENWKAKPWSVRSSSANVFVRLG
jgi:hypothetical protein